MNSPTVIDIEQLHISYGDFHAVKDLTFSVRRGELYALLGTNGAGKTSTLEVIEGHRPATSGRVRILGEDPMDRRAVRHRTGIMLQESGFAADLSVRETLALIGGLSGRQDQPSRVLDVVGLTSKADVRVASLSGGEKRRLDFATAVYGSPELIFPDEPTTGLDVQSRDDLWESVDRLREDGATIVLTTHYLEEAQQRADRIGLMHEGTLRRQGTVSELTRTLPGTISFALDEELVPHLPLQSSPTDHDRQLIRTEDLQQDLHALLTWAHASNTVLRDLDAGPTRLDDVFRAVSRH